MKPPSPLSGSRRPPGDGAQSTDRRTECDGYLGAFEQTIRHPELVEGSAPGDAAFYEKIREDESFSEVTTAYRGSFANASTHRRLILRQAQDDRFLQSRAFTLLEMMITMAIFVLIAAAVFGIMTSVLHSVSTLQDNQDRRDQTAALNAFLKKKLGEVPAQGVVLSYRRGEGEGLTQNGIMFGDRGNLMAIDAHVQDNGYYLLRSAIFTLPLSQNVDPVQVFLQDLQSNDGSLNWTPLIHDIQQISWKFQDVNVTQWVDLWNNSGAKPNLIELSVKSASDLQPATMDFWIPQIVPATIVLPPTATNAP